MLDEVKTEWFGTSDPCMYGHPWSPMGTLDPGDQGCLHKFWIFPT